MGLKNVSKKKTRISTGLFQKKDVIKVLIHPNQHDIDA